MVSDDELYRRHVKGEITLDQYLQGIEKNCRHKPEIEEIGNGKWVEWCDKCGARLAEGRNPDLVGSGSGSGSAKAVKVKGGCAVVAVLMLGAAGGLGWLVVDLLA